MKTVRVLKLAVFCACLSVVRVSAHTGVEAALWSIFLPALIGSLGAGIAKTRLKPVQNIGNHELTIGLTFSVGFFEIILTYVSLLMAVFFFNCKTDTTVLLTSGTIYFLVAATLQCLIVRECSHRAIKVTIYTAIYPFMALMSFLCLRVLHFFL